MLSLSDKISALYLCADILDDPTDEYLEKVRKLQDIVGIRVGYLKEDLDDICSENVKIFSIRSKELKCVRYASWWLDGKMGGRSLKKIVDFYKYCGYFFDSEQLKKPADDVSVMLTFLAILLEEGRFKEVEEFAKFLTWLTDFANSLKSASSIRYFWFAADISRRLILLKEELKL